MFSVKDSSGIEYMDNKLTKNEYNILCGIYRLYTSSFDLHFFFLSSMLMFLCDLGFSGQVAQLSWFPSLDIFKGSGMDNRQWTLLADDLYDKCVQSINNEKGGLPNFNFPLLATKWRDKVHGYTDVRRAKKQLDKWSKDFIEDNVGCL
ncbi:hypothetical protein AN958_10000 [Leucoagaricus sp. SymC.cos]|nr:hypothetical protein AN958_10000 [Leucoagaricus sp. SymC.cos]